MGSTIVSSGIGTMVGFLISTRQSLIQAEHKIGAFSIYDDAEKVTVGSVCRFLWYHLKYLSGWYTNRPLTILVVLFIMWVIWGTGLTMKLEGYTFIQGVYWSVTTMATGGLQSATCLDGTSGTTCDLGSLRGGFMGFFMMLGVPLYCVTIGQVARITVAASLQEHQKQLLRKPIEDADFIFAANVLSPEGSTTLVLGEYILLELMRLGATDQHQIEYMKRKFYQLDRMKRGELRLEDLRSSGMVVPRKLHSVEVARRIRSRSMELFDTLRHSASNLTESIVAATGGTPMRRQSGYNHPRAHHDDHSDVHDHAQHVYQQNNDAGSDVEMSSVSTDIIDPYHRHRQPLEPQTMVGDTNNVRRQLPFDTPNTVASGGSRSLVSAPRDSPMTSEGGPRAVSGKKSFRKSVNVPMDPARAPHSSGHGHHHYNGSGSYQGASSLGSQGGSHGRSSAFHDDDDSPHVHFVHPPRPRIIPDDPFAHDFDFDKDSPRHPEAKSESPLPPAPQLPPSSSSPRLQSSSSQAAPATGIAASTAPPPSTWDELSDGSYHSYEGDVDITKPSPDI